ncbi:hypothetical protein FSP39_003950 [Pinctada imbricata]|uniref:T-complex protein 1 subunit beta n=1 Tax=Pinctada imbricata TaxID=66713 RepID=A0AA88Y3B5_PINIB|nr:hypothetical protein FSP39_003950 [Pinctada imbricata]
MDKILQSGEGIQVTNDGATILKSIGIDNPAAKVLVDISKVQDDEVGDGTTSVVVLASELLREAESLVSQRIHPQTVIAGWRKATDEARRALEAFARDHGNDESKFREDLMNIARTTLSSKILTQYKDHFAKLAVDAVLRLKGSGNLDAIHLIKKSGAGLKDSYLDEGFLLDKKIGVNQPKRIENAKILVANTPMDTDKVKVKQLIYNYPEQLFADAGIMAIEHADFEGVERLSLVTGGEIVSTFDTPDSVKLGKCDVIEEVIIGEDKLIKFSGVAMGEACTIVLRGATKQILDEADRSLHDALCVLTQTVKNTKTVYGGGSAEMLMADAVSKLAAKTPGKEAVAMEAFAKALRMLPTTIADNAGYDSAQLISELRALHTDGKHTMGLNMTDGEVADVEKMGITESFQVKRQMLLSASEAAEMIIRIDDIIKSAPRPRQPDHRGH